MRVEYSNGKVLPEAVAVVWEDNHCERAGYFRAFWAETPDADCGSPVVGYCSPGGSHRTIRATVAEFRRLYPGERIFRNGKEVLP